MPLNRIKQTNKTILIEAFNEDYIDLYTLLKNEDYRRISDFFKKLEKLEVRNFKEFVEKFMPTVWEWTELDENDQDCPIRFCYAMEKPSGVDCQPMDLSEEKFYKAIMNLYDRKSSSGKDNLDFDYSNIVEMLSPTKEMDIVMQMRKDLKYNYEKALELKDMPGIEQKKYRKKVKEIRKKIVERYQNNKTGYIRLLLADVEKKLEALENRTRQGTFLQSGESKEQKRIPCRYDIDENGELLIESIEESDIDVYENEKEMNHSLNQIAEKIGMDFERYSNVKSTYLKNIVVACYSGDTNLSIGLDKQELLKKRDQYSSIYQKSEHEFISVISAAVEKMLDVKVFFDHAAPNGTDLKTPLLVTNCNAGKLLSDAKVQEGFRYFISQMGSEIDSNHIWFAIIPAIDHVDFCEDTDIEDSIYMSDEDDLFDEDFAESSEIKCTKNSNTTLDDVKSMLEILKSGKITTVFNFKANEKTGFNGFSENIVEQYRKNLESIEGNEYAVFAYPNFTVLPKKETTIEIGKRRNQGEEEKIYLNIPGIYVEASYVAAGLLVASQRPEYLKEKGYYIKQQNPCVRFDLEEGDNNMRLLTRMNCEGMGNWDLDAEKNIQKDKFGFCFCGNATYFDNKRIQNTYVYFARNMARNPQTNLFYPIFKRLTMDFILQYINTESKVNKEVVRNFIKDEVRTWKQSDIGYDNSILHENETIEFDEDSGNLKIKFQDMNEGINLKIMEK